MKARLSTRAPASLLGALLVLAAGAAAANDNYIGAARCKTCHEFEFEVWAKGPHAVAHKSLTAAQLQDPKCSTCHTMSPGDLSERLVAVQCERCHGAGKYYHLDFVMRDQELARAVGLVDVTAAHCEQCHTAGTPSIEPFDFARMWAEIDHGPAARKKWEAGRKRAQAEGGASARGAAAP